MYNTTDYFKQICVVWWCWFVDLLQVSSHFISKAHTHMIKKRSEILA